MFDSAAVARAERPGLLRFMFLPIGENLYKTFPPIGVVAIPQGSLSCPCGAIHLQFAQLRFRLSAKTPPASLLLRFPTGPLRWVPAGALSRIGSKISLSKTFPPIRSVGEWGAYSLIGLLSNGPYLLLSSIYRSARGGKPGKLSSCQSLKHQVHAGSNSCGSS